MTLDTDIPEGGPDGKHNAGYQEEEQGDFVIKQNGTVVIDLPEKYPQDELADEYHPYSGRDAAGGGEMEEDEAEKEEEDPWNAVPLFRKKVVTPWDELECLGKTKRVAWDWIFLTLFKIVSLLGLLYIFVCSLQVMSSAFQLLGGKAAGEVLSNDIINNPVCGLMMGVMVTVLVQSSSTSTSIIVSMVAAEVISVTQAIPIVMGANIGTSVTNTLIALTQAKDRNTFRRAFGGATVHDMFNWLSVMILLPLEVATGYLEWLSEVLLEVFNVSPNSDVDVDLLDAITKPVTSKIVQINKAAITDIAINDTSSDEVSLLKRCAGNETGPDCDHLFAYTSLSDAAVGGILLVGSLLTLCICLILLVKLLQWALSGSLAFVIRKAVNADFPGYFSFLTGYFAMLVGAVCTFLVQSSSVFTSALTPLVGIGLITIERIYPLTLGSNIGTTGTSILAAFSQVDNFSLALQISMCHLFFNISGIIIWYPIPFLRQVPIHLAKNLGNDTAKYRWVAVCYLLFAFFLLPVIVFGLSLAGQVVFFSVGIPIFIFVAIVVLINILQAKANRFLPEVLRDWTFLPKPLRSFQPYDRPIANCGNWLSVHSCCKCCSSSQLVDEEAVLEMSVVKEDEKKAKQVVSTIS